LINNKEFIINSASLCPFEYGPAVYTNRSLAKGMDFSWDVNDIDACGPIDSRNSGPGSSIWAGVYPNPSLTNQEINIASTREIKHLVISDLLGNIILRKNDLKDRSLKVKISNPGLYIINMEGHDGTIHTNKILVLDK
jgi:hypothetical protein